VSRPYHQFCGVAKALDVVGERWTLLVVRELLLGPRRFGEISEALTGVPPALLTQRLKDLEAAGLVEKAGRRAPYALTETGRELEPVVLALGRFGARYLVAPEEGDRMDMRWAMLSLQRRYVGDHGRWTLELRPGDGVFTVELGAAGRGVSGRSGAIEVRDGAATAPDVVVAGPAMAIGGLFLGRARLDTLVEGAVVTLEGERAAMEALLAGLGLA